VSGPVARSCVCGANRRLFNTALEFLKLVYQDSGSRAGRTRGVIAPRVALLRLPVAQQMCIPDLRPRPVAPSCGWELKVWITVDSAAALVDEKTDFLCAALTALVHSSDRKYSLCASTNKQENQVRTARTKRKPKENKRKPKERTKENQ